MRKEDVIVQPQPFYNSTDLPLVLDASVVINLLGSGDYERLLNALPHRILVTDTVFDELARGGALSGWPHGDLLSAAASKGLVEKVSLEAEGEEVFEDLVIGADSSTLDDGEAATLAFASQHGSVAIIDEKKAFRIVEERYPAILVGTTVDLFFHPAYFDLIGPDELSSVVLSALKNARMNILPHQQKTVVEFIGLDRVRGCRSLPKSIRSVG